MSNFDVQTELYIEHEVKLRLHDSKFNSIEKSIDRLDAGLKHLENKFMVMFGILLGSVWLPSVLHFLKVW
jgi:hypothetical protein